MGRVQNVESFQPSAAYLNYNYDAAEQVDPAFERLVDCPSGYLCRYSDAAYFGFKAEFQDVDVDWRRAVARTTSGTQIDVSRPYEFLESASNQVPVYGSYMTKVGAATGRTRGRVTKTCFNRSVATGSNLYLFCQARVAAAARSGDSGAPAYQAEF